MDDFNEDTLVYKFINGGIGYGKLCVPNTLIDLILIVVFPPLYVISYQVQKYLKADKSSKKLVDHLDITQIAVSFILTSCFYFPGFLHALSVMKGKEKCGSLFK